MSKTMNIEHIVELGNALCKLITELSTELDKCGESRIGYGDVISTIVNGDYFSSQKKTLMAMIQNGRDEAYYESVIVILNSDMWLSDKIEAIKHL